MGRLRIIGPALAIVLVVIMARGGGAAGILAPFTGWIAAGIWGLIGIAVIVVILAWKRERER